MYKSFILLFLIAIICNVKFVNAQEVQNSDSVYINEVFPNPTNESYEEYVEIFNATDNVINLTGWKISDSSSTDNLIDIDTHFSYDLPGLNLPAQSYALIIDNDFINHLQETGLFLESLDTLTDNILILTTSDTTIGNGLGNNTDSLKLIDNYGNIISSIQWHETKENISLERDNDGSFSNNKCNTITPGKINDIQTSKCSFLDNSLLQNIYLNEVMPNPEGADEGKEWIELINIANEQISLDNLILVINSNNYVLTNKYINPNDFLVIYSDEFNFSLTNTSESIKLVTTSGEVIDEFNYTQSITNQSWSRVEEEWRIDYQNTPGEINMPKLTNENDTDDNSSTIMSINDAKNEEISHIVTISGRITSDIGILGSNIFYIQDDTGGMQIYATDPPQAFKLGDQITMSGTISNFHEEKRLTYKKGNLFQVNNETLIVKAIPITAREVNDTNEGKLVIVSGELVSTSGDTFTLKDSAGRIKIQVKNSTKIETFKRSKGKLYTITGIVSQYDKNTDGTANFRILPRYSSDIIFEQRLTSLAHTGNNKSNNNFIGLTFVLLSTYVLIRYQIYAHYFRSFSISSKLIVSFMAKFPILSRLKLISVPPDSAKILLPKS